MSHLFFSTCPVASEKIAAAPGSLSGFGTSFTETVAAAPPGARCQSPQNGISLE